MNNETTEKLKREHMARERRLRRHRAELTRRLLLRPEYGLELAAYAKVATKEPYRISMEAMQKFIAGFEVVE